MRLVRRRSCQWSEPTTAVPPAITVFHRNCLHSPTLWAYRDLKGEWLCEIETVSFSDTKSSLLLLVQSGG